MVLPASPLPQNPYTAPNEWKWHDAYDACLKIEPASTGDTEKDVVYARILGYLILEAPASAGRDYISEEILNCEGNTTKLLELAEFFVSSVMPICESHIPPSLVGFKLHSSSKKTFKVRK